MLNKVMLIGRLGQDPQLRYTQVGSPVVNFSVATDEFYNDRDGQRQQKTEWHKIVVFDRQAETCNNFLSKGSLVYIEGKIQTRKWQDQQGQDRTTTEIVAQRVQFLDRRGEGGQNQQDDEYGQRPQQQGGYQKSQARQSYQQRDNQPKQPRRQEQAQHWGADQGQASPPEGGSEQDEVPF